MELSEITKRLQEVVESAENATARGIENAAMRIGEDAQARAPAEFGDLRGSMYVDIDETNVIHDGGGLQTVTAEIGFSSKYAAAQHEHIEYNHPSLARQRRQARGGANDPYFNDAGEAKYLEKAVVQLVDSGDLMRIITERMWDDA